MIDDTLFENIGLITPEVTEYPLFTLYRHLGREIGISFKTRDYRHADLFCNDITFMVDTRVKGEPEYLIPEDALPLGQEEKVSQEELSVLLYLFRNANAARPIGYDLYLAIKLLMTDYVFVLSLIMEPAIKPEWLKIEYGGCPTIAMLDTMRVLGNLRGSFDERYLILSDPPEATSDLDVAMLESIKIGHLPVDLYGE